MSQTQIVFNADKALKAATAAKLKKEGNTFKSLFQYTMLAYIQWKISLGLITDSDKRDPELEKDYQKAIKDLKAGKNVVERDELIKKYGVSDQNS